ncbi:MAG: hypothetical protein KH330_05980 [Clostridiales bacterium]|nr:hypothetical protein [Clostridiales bacterium]
MNLRENTRDEHHHDHHSETVKERHMVNGQEKFSLESHSHDGASIVSGECILSVEDPETVRTMLAEQMQRLGDWVNEKEGYIGHIKAGFSTECTESFSITDRKVRCHSPESTRIHINLAAIVFMISPDELKKQVKNIFLTLTADTEEKKE